MNNDAAMPRVLPQLFMPVRRFIAEARNSLAVLLLTQLWDCISCSVNAGFASLLISLEIS